MKYIDKNEFDKLYYIEELSGVEIAKIMGYEQKVIYRWMKKNNRPTINWILNNYPYPEKKVCSVCKELLSLNKFSKLSINYDNHMARCKKCDRKIAKEYHIRNLDKIKKYGKEYRNIVKNRIKIKYRSYKTTHEKKFNSVFPLTMEDISILVKCPCVYCSGIDIPINGIDRLDNSIGYEKDNVVPCCRKCNTMKLDLTFDEFRSHIISVYNKICRD